MKRKILAAFLTLILAAGITAVPAAAQSGGVSAPEHFGACRYVSGDYFTFTASAPEDMRRMMDSSAGKAEFSGYARVQIDYKLDNGSWHYEGDWDTFGKTPNYIVLQFKENQNYQNGARAGLPSLFPDSKGDFEQMKSSKDYFTSHAITFRARFAVQLDGSKDTIFSDWSDPFVYSMSAKSEPERLMSHAPELISAEVKKNSGGSPFIVVTTGRLPGETQDLQSMAAGAVWTEIWLRKAGDKDFRKVNDSFFSNEYITFDVNDYFNKALADYSQEAYEVKIRYRIDLRAYLQAGRSDTIFSPFSDVISQNMPAWNGASAWAAPELKKADDEGLIPSILNGADMTRPITREEFAALALKLYEKVTGQTASAAQANPFSDTSNPEVLKAYQLGITTGTSSTTFDPKDLTNREQVATMLSRAIRIMAPNGDFSTDGAPVFSDSADISSWAAEHVKFMSKAGIIKGSNGKFMPRATTTAQQASGYAVTTREQAIAMSVRIFEQY